MNQRGQFSLPILGWVAIAAGVAFVAMGIALKVQSSRLDTCKTEAATFKAQVEANGKIAEAKAKEKIAADLANKQRTDNETTKLRAANATLARQLRDNRAASSFLPATGSPSGSPQSITFDRAKLERTIQQLDEGVSGLIARGDQAVIDLNLSLKWAQEIKP